MLFSRLLSKIIFLDYKIIQQKGFQLSNCPKCGEFATLERLAEKSAFNTFLRKFGYKKYHCMKCKWDGYLHTKRITENPKRVFKNYVIAVFWFLVFALVLAFALQIYYDTL